MPVLIRFLLLALALGVLPAQAGNAPEQRAYVTDGTVNAVLRDGANLYLGGDFSYIGPNNGHGVGLSVNDGVPDSTDPRISGVVGSAVYAAVADGDGGWYIGGDFSTVADQTRVNLAHVTTDKTVDAGFDLSTDGAVRALALSSDGTTLYVGGDFTTIGGQARSRLAAIDLSDGTVSPWVKPIDNGSVRVLTLSAGDNTLYVGGTFTSVDGDATAIGIVALDTATGALSATWNTANSIDAGAVNALTLDQAGTSLYVGGTFTAIGGAVRNRLAKLSAVSGVADATWNPNADGEVNGVAVYEDAADSSRDRVFIGGDFTNVGVTPATRLASLNLTDGAVDGTWTHEADARVTTVVTGSSVARVFVGGEFLNIDGSRARYSASFPVITNAVTWTRDANGPVRAMALSADETTVFTGGDFTSLGGVKRDRLANVSSANGALGPWVPKISNGTVYSLAISSDATRVYVGGDFTDADGNVRNRVAAFSSSLGTLLDWSANVENGAVHSLALASTGVPVRALAVDPGNRNILYAGTEDGLYRSSNAGTSWSKISLTTSSANITDILIDPNTPTRVYVAIFGSGIIMSNDRGLTWNAVNNGLSNLNIVDLAITADSSALYGGAVLDSSGTGSLFKSTDAGATWEPKIQDRLSFVSVATDPNDTQRVYIGTPAGVFRSDSGAEVPGEGLAPFTRATEGLPASGVSIVVVSHYQEGTSSDSMVYAINGAVVYRSTNAGAAWKAVSSGLGRNVISEIILDPADPQRIFLASSVGGAYLSSDGGRNFRPRNSGLSNPILYALALDPSDGSTLYAGGSLGLVFKTSDAADTWSETHDGIPNDTLYIGGTFTGSHPDYLAALDTTQAASSRFLAWDPAPDAPIYTLALSDDHETLYAAGDFTLIGGAARARVAALNTADANATTWAPSVDDGRVNAIQLSSDGATLALGGSFTSVNVTGRNRIAALSTVDGALRAWDPSADAEVSSLILSGDDSLAFVSGSFTNVHGAPRRYMASLTIAPGFGAAAETTWDPQPDAPVTGRQALAFDTNTAYVGGAFTEIGSTLTPSFAMFKFAGPTVSITPVPQAYNSPQTISLSCVDAVEQPCVTIYFTTDTDLDNATWQIYNTPLTIAEQTTFTYFGVDSDGIRSNNESKTYVIDFAAPTVSADINSGTYTYTQTVELTCNDGSPDAAGVSECANIFYTKDGSTPTFRTITDPTTGLITFEASGATEGYVELVPIIIDTELRFLAVDAAGNVSEVGTRNYSIVRGETGALAAMELLLIVVASIGARWRQRYFNGGMNSRQG